MAGKKTTKKTTKAKIAKKAEEKAPEKPEAKVKEEPKAAAKPKEEPKAKEAPKAEEKAKPQKKAAKKKRTKKKAAKKKVTRAVVARGKRKESIARATVKKGTGVIRLNSINVESMTNPYIREIIIEPLRYMGPEASTVNISVRIDGGGKMGQAQAARTAIARALSEYFTELNLKAKFAAIDRSLVVEDTRRVETKKYRGPKARARYQKSYR
jgi:small subunit ribosomal protein S9